MRERSRRRRSREKKGERQKRRGSTSLSGNGISHMTERGRIWLGLSKNDHLSYLEGRSAPLGEGEASVHSDENILVAIVRREDKDQRFGIFCRKVTVISRFSVTKLKIRNVLEQKMARRSRND